ncbi:lytic transglycosylase domain-containing protein [Salmonella enterica]
MSISTSAFLALAIQCAPNVHTDTLQALVRTESGFNPYAIGVVGPPLAKQPTSLNEALDAIKSLNKAGLKYSLGLSQIYIGNLANEPDISSVFEPCKNLRLGANILSSCYQRALTETDDQQDALKKAFSCYYSNNFTRGFKKENNGSSYVERVINNADKNAGNKITVPAIIKTPQNNESDNNQIQPQKSAPRKKWDIYSDFNI